MWNDITMKEMKTNEPNALTVDTNNCTNNNNNINNNSNNNNNPINDKNKEPDDSHIEKANRGKKTKQIIQKCLSIWTVSVVGDEKRWKRK